MLKSIGATAAVYPCPVLIVGTYDADGTANAMNVAKTSNRKNCLMVRPMTIGRNA